MSPVCAPRAAFAARIPAAYRDAVAFAAITTLTPAPVRNGNDTAHVYSTIDALEAQPELARFEFRATNRWINGTHSRSTIHGFWGAGQEDDSREAPFVLDAAEPPVLFGHNEAPNPAGGRVRSRP